MTLVSHAPARDEPAARLLPQFGITIPSVRIDLLSFSADVTSDCPEVVERLGSLYPPVAIGWRGSTDSARQRFAVVSRQGGPGERYDLFQNRDWVGEFAALPDAVVELESILSLAAIAALRHHILIHAGAVVSGRGGIVFPGASGRGKSTLVTGLCLSGLGYFSDDLAVVDSRSSALMPFLKPVCLKDGGWKAVSSCFEDVPASELDGTRRDRQRVHYLALPRPRLANRRTGIRYVVLPRRRAAATARLVPVSRAVGLSELARHSLNLPGHGRAGVESLARIVEKAECYALEYDDLGGAIAAVTDLVGRGDRPTPVAGRPAVAAGIDG